MGVDNFSVFLLRKHFIKKVMDWSNSIFHGLLKVDYNLVLAFTFSVGHAYCEG